MSEKTPDPSPEEIAKAREQVAERVKEEGSETKPAAPAIDNEFVKRCLYAGQKGDGLLFAALHKGKYLCAPELKNQWFEWTGAYWKQVTVYRTEAAVEAVVEKYDALRLDCEAKVPKPRRSGTTRCRNAWIVSPSGCAKTSTTCAKAPGSQPPCGSPCPTRIRSSSGWKISTRIRSCSAWPTAWLTCAPESSARPGPAIWFGGPAASSGRGSRPRARAGRPSSRRSSARIRTSPHS